MRPLLLQVHSKVTSTRPWTDVALDRSEPAEMRARRLRIPPASSAGTAAWTVYQEQSRPGPAVAGSRPRSRGWDSVQGSTGGALGREGDTSEPEGRIRIGRHLTPAESNSVAIRYPRARGRAGQRRRPTGPSAQDWETSPRIPHRSPRTDTAQRRSCRSGGQWTHKPQDPKGLENATPTGHIKTSRQVAKPLVRPTFPAGGRCRIRTCVGIRRRIYRTEVLAR
jgi:hypothetical protein